MLYLSLSNMYALASLGIRRSPIGENLTVTTLVYFSLRLVVNVAVVELF